MSVNVARDTDIHTIHWCSVIREAGYHQMRQTKSKSKERRSQREQQRHKPLISAKKPSLAGVEGEKGWVLRWVGNTMEPATPHASILAGIQLSLGVVEIAAREQYLPSGNRNAPFHELGNMSRW